MINVGGGRKMWVVGGMRDMGKGLNGVGGKVERGVKDEGMWGEVLMLGGGRGSEVKVVWWRGDGVWVVRKGVEGGGLGWG